MDELELFRSEFPDQTDEQLQQGYEKIKQVNPEATPQEAIEIAKKAQASMGAAAAPAQTGIQNPMVRDHIQKVYGDKFSDSARQKIVDENAADASGPNWRAGLAAFGAALQGGNAAEAGQSFLKGQQAKRDAKLSEFDKARSGKLADYQQNRQLGADIDGDAVKAAERDPNSPESRIAQDLAISMGMNPQQVSGLTAEKFKSFSPVMQKKYDIEQRKLDRADARAERYALFGERKAERQEAKQEKLDEKMQSMQTPYGLANSVDDAKQLKEAHESKKNFDSKLSEMIALRSKHDGGATFNREDVGRGKQLSKDLLLEYKNMAKLGVLSAADEAIINEIIPADPLEYNSPLAAIQGQDPILHKLKSFKADSDKDFQTRVSTRTRDGGKQFAETSASPSVDVQSGSADEQAKKRQARIAELRAKQSRSVAR